MTHLILVLVSSAFATPSCQEAYSILAMDEECAEADSPAPICVHARTIVAMCEEREAVADVEPIEEPTPVASAPVRTQSVVASVIVVRDPDPLPPTVWTVPPIPVSASWKYTLPGVSSPPIGADPATQWAELREQEQWTAIHKADAKASAAMVATDNLYTSSSK